MKLPAHIEHREWLSDTNEAASPRREWTMISANDMRKAAFDMRISVAL
jgi:hypothetical protein